jgi:hypothetical protein
MKKFSIISISILGALVAVLMIIPLFYSVDSLRPEIQKNIQQSLNAEVEISKIGFQLFPSIKVFADNVVVNPKAQEFSRENLLSLDRVQLQMPLLKLLMSPEASIVLKGARVALIQSQKSSNLESIFPPENLTNSSSANSTQAATKSESTASPAVGELLDSLPSFLSNKIRNAKLHFEILDSNISVIQMDAPKDSKMELNAFSLKLNDIGLSSPMLVSLDTLVDINQDGAKMNGPVKVSGSVKYNPQGQTNIIELNITKDLSQLDIQYAPLFRKKSGTALAAEATATVKQNSTNASLEFSKLALKFANVSVAGTMNAEVPLANPTEGNVKLNLNVKDFEISAWGALVPMVADYSLGGKVNMDINVSGKIADPTLAIDTQLTKVTGASPELKTPITDLTGRLNVSGQLSDPVINVRPFSMKIGKSDLGLSVKARGAKKISAEIEVYSNLIDADEILGLKPLNLEETSAESAAASGVAANSANSAAAPVLPLDQSLIEMAPMVEESLKNPNLDTLVASFKLDFKSLKAMGASFRNIKTEVVVKDRVLTMKKTGLQGYGGQLSAEMGLNFKKPESMGFDFNSKLIDIDFASVLKTHAPTWQKEMSGKLNGDLSVQGAGLRKEQLASNLKGGLNGEFKNGRLSLPVEKVINLALDELPKLKFLNSKIPERNKQQKALGEFKVCKIQTQINGRKVMLKTLDVIYDTKGGGLGDFEFKSQGEIDFDQNLEVTGLALMSPETVRIPELKGPSGKIEIPLKLRGTLAAPDTDISYTLKILGERVAQNLLKSEAAQKIKTQLEAAKNKAKEETKQAAEAVVKKAAEEAIQKAPEPVKKELEKLKSKFKF